MSDSSYNSPTVNNMAMDDEIDLKELFMVLWSGKWLISAVTGVAAAMEGAFLDLPSMAVSLEGHEGRHFETAAKIIKSLVELSTKVPLSRKRTFLNINVPDIPYNDIQGIEVTRLGKRHSAQPTIIQKDPRGETIYWVGPVGEASDAEKGTDFFALAHQKVSITPMKIDMTDHESGLDIANWLGLLSKKTSIGD